MFKLKWSLRQQIVSPLVLLSVLFIFWIADRVTSRRQYRMDALEDQAVLTLAHELFAAPPRMISDYFAMRRAEFPGWEFLVFKDDQLVHGSIVVSERDRSVLNALPARLPDRPGRDHRMSFESAVYGAKDWFWITKLTGQDTLHGSELVLLYSTKFGDQIDAQLDRQDEMIAVGLTVGLIAIAVWYSGRLSRRIIQIERQVRLVAQGQSLAAVDDSGCDELSDLAHSVNVMVVDLGHLKKCVAEAERARLHTQLGRGIAHELRNGIHSARLALEMYCEESAEGSASSLLKTSHDQLSVTELLVRRLLAVGQTDVHEKVAQPMRDVVEDAARLMDPMFRHAAVKFSTDLRFDQEAAQCEDAESMRSAIINLCLNALEATGRHGDAVLMALLHAHECEISVSDSGSGPPEELGDSIFEPFVTTKPEGVGLGLVLVRQAATAAGGTATWTRRDHRTVFSIKLPVSNPHTSPHHAPESIS